MLRSASDVSAALIAKGMQTDENHHTMYPPEGLNGVTTLVTRISHRLPVPINDSLAKLMANQCCLQLKEFWELVGCTLSAEQWDAKLSERCAGGRNPFLRR